MDAGSETSVSAEHAKAKVFDTATAWMQFDTGEGSNKPVMLDISYTLFPLVYPASDFSPLLLRILRWIVVKKFHKIRTGDDEEWPIFRINDPNVIDGEYAGEIRTCDETKLPWSRHQLIIPDPFVPTHVCHLVLDSLLEVDEVSRTMHLIYTEALYITSPC